LSATPNADLEFDQALQDALGQSLATLPNRSAVAVALSGGIDSVALALVAKVVCKQTEHPLHFFHVHHGLYAEADAWAAHYKGWLTTWMCRFRYSMSRLHKILVWVLRRLPGKRAMLPSQTWHDRRA
jgi:3'-phosphoadenosine 5'-phosphosulfate sulfotransferase (PAPS reductase)/FAD synthetase